MYLINQIVVKSYSSLELWIVKFMLDKIKERSILFPSPLYCKYIPRNQRSLLRPWSHLVAVGRGYVGLPSWLEHDQPSRLSQVGLSQVKLNYPTGQNITSPLRSGQVRLGWVGSKEGGREPLDAISLHYADTSLPDLLGRMSLCYAAMSMRNTSKCACVIQEGF